ncbi:nitrilase-related carbon-nitrogen hydrolase [Actinomadura rupiterrae]|uniref:nitrilase-related carbon-nitrogen hydrolase n=1 Tax=Actinomadura rupiterrae TaxID=559627 RepID=UPI0020A5690C|nr:nitrilase-related carbon-nitrogen hydrolase [Actinomadura rupiterrae]MCP2335664.1 apolipoprotein N-acyltransferase [Actinomadura rupiterrae]
MRIVLVVLSGVLFAFGTGLHPVFVLTWLAPLPLLWAVPRMGGRAAFAAATLAWLAGQARMASYFKGVLEMPVPAIVGILVLPALVFGGLAVAYRRLVVADRPLIASAVFAAGWTTMEYVFSLTLPHGAWWSIAYSQADVGPVVQFVSVTGIWGVTFLLMGVPAAVATLRPRAVGTGAALLALVLGFGTIRTATASAPHGETVALLATEHPNDEIDVASPEGRRLLAGYIAQARTIDAAAIVLPEKTFVADDRTLPLLSGPLSRLAVERHAAVVAGLIHKSGGKSSNSAIVYPADGGRPAEYVKHHLIPGLEEEFTPGTSRVSVPGRPRWGVIICKDLDFPGLVRGYRSDGAAALLAPAWDFHSDAWLHGRMALVRGVESGLAVARNARAGDLTISDPYGRVQATRSTDHPGFVTVSAQVPYRAVSTLYARLGDWFAWLCIAFLITTAIAVPLTRKRRPGSHAATPAEKAEAPLRPRT